MLCVLVLTQSTVIQLLSLPSIPSLRTLPLLPSILRLTTLLHLPSHSLPPPPSNPMKAADWAFQAKDPSALTRILDQHTDNVEVKNAVESYLDRLPR